MKNKFSVLLGGMIVLIALAYVSAFFTPVVFGQASGIGRLVCANLGDSVASCSTDTTSATNISSGTLANARLAAQVVLTNQANTWSTGLQSMSAADWLSPVHSSDPGTCTAGQFEFNSTSPAFKGCTSTNTWTAFTTGGSGTVNSGTANQVAYYASTGTAVSGNANFTLTSGGIPSTVDGITTAGVGVPIIGWVSNVTSQSTSQSAVTVATSPTAGSYKLVYYANENAVCTTGSNSVSFTFNWTDGGNARSLATGSLSLAAAQSTTAGFISGELPLFVNSGNVTYTSTVAGTCASGTSTYDIHATLMRLQ